MVNVEIGDLLQEQIKDDSKIIFENNTGLTKRDIPHEITNLSLHTGVIDGMVKSINADDTRFDITAGTAIKVDRTDPLNVIVTVLNFAGVTAQLDTNLGVALSHVYVDIVTGVVTTELNPPTVSDLINRIYLGILLHNGVSVIVEIVPNAIYATGSSDTEIIGLAFGDAETLETGQLSPNGANLQLDTEASLLKQHGRGFIGNPNLPNIIAGPAQTPIPVGDFFLVFINGSGDLVGDGTGNVLDPTQFNEGGLGTLELVANNQFTTIRVFEAGVTNDKIFYYGTEEFSTAVGALTDTGTAWVEHEGTRDISPKAVMAVRQDVVDLSSALASGFFVIHMIRTRSQL